MWTTSSRHIESQTNLHLTESSIAKIDKIRDLGILIEYKLSFKIHTDSIVKKARQRMSLIFKVLKLKDPEILKRAYYTYILPIILYGSHLFALNNVYNTNLLEKIQGKFTRCLFLDHPLALIQSLMRKISVGKVLEYLYSSTVLEYFSWVLVKSTCFVKVPGTWVPVLSTVL